MKKGFCQGLWHPRKELVSGNAKRPIATTLGVAAASNGALCWSVEPTEAGFSVLIGKLSTYQRAQWDRNGEKHPITICSTATRYNVLNRSAVATHLHPNDCSLNILSLTATLLVSCPLALMRRS